MIPIKTEFEHVQVQYITNGPLLLPVINELSVYTNSPLVVSWIMEKNGDQTNGGQRQVDGMYDCTMLYTKKYKKNSS